MQPFLQNDSIYCTLESQFFLEKPIDSINLNFGTVYALLKM